LPRTADKEDVLSSVSENLAVSAAGAATSQRRRQRPSEEPEDVVELSSEARAAGQEGNEQEDLSSD
jgi:hypothetical protein